MQRLFQIRSFDLFFDLPKIRLGVYVQLSLSILDVRLVPDLTLILVSGFFSWACVWSRGSARKWGRELGGV